eukprot:CRZ01791.1 hypothetical protein [Spongospora subterranea]
MKLPSTFSRIYIGLTSLLSNSDTLNGAPFSRVPKELACHHEVFIMFWKLLSISPEFLTYVCTRAEKKSLLQPLFFIMSRSKNDQALIGLVHTCALIILKLSDSRDFALAFNESCNGSTFFLKDGKIVTSANGCFADIFVIASCDIISSNAHVESLDHVLLTAMVNISPYVRELSWSASEAIVALFILLASGDIIWSTRTSPQYVMYLLEMINNLIQYQYNGNGRLFFVMAQNANVFLSLGLPASSIQGSMHDNSSQGSQEESSAAHHQQPSFEPIECKQGNSQDSDSHENWVNDWRRKFPLSTVNKMLEFILPRMNVLYESSVPSHEDSHIIAFFQSQTLVGIIPLPHPIIVRRYRPSKSTSVWFSSVIWGQIFLRNQKHVVFDPRSIRLFAVSEPVSNAGTSS